MAIDVYQQVFGNEPIGGYVPSFPGDTAPLAVLPIRTVGLASEVAAAAATNSPIANPGQPSLYGDGDIKVLSAAGSPPASLLPWGLLALAGLLVAKKLRKRG